MSAKLRPPALKNLLSLLHDSLYVDDCLSSVESPEAAEEFRTASVTCLQKANMTLRKWRGNTMRDEQASGEKSPRCPVENRNRHPNGGR